MSRIPLDKHVLKLAKFRDLQILVPADGAHLYVYERGTTNQVTGYTTENGSTQVTYPLVANAMGEFTAWYEAGWYDLYSPDDILNPTVPWGMMPGPQGEQGDPGPPGGDRLTDMYDLVEDFGADPTGASNSSVAINAGVAQVKQYGGTLWCAGLFRHDSPIEVHDYGEPFRITGPGGHPAHNHGVGMFLYKGAGTGWEIYSCGNWEIDHLRFIHDYASGPDAVINIDGGAAGVTWADPMRWHLHHISTAGTIANVMADSAIRLNRSIIGQIDHCHIAGGGPGIRYGDDAGQYVVGVKIGPLNTFNYNHDHIRVGSADAENMTIENNVFEDPGSGYSAIRGGTGNNCYSPQILHNWFGDGTAGSNWIRGLNTGNKPGTIAGNKMSDSTQHIGVSDDMTGHWIVEGNEMDGGTFFAFNAGSTKLVVRDNLLNNGTIFATQRPSDLEASGNICTGTGESKQLRDSIPPRLAVGSRSWGNYPLEAGPADVEQLIVGVHNADAYPDLGNKGALYVATAGGAIQRTVLQAPADSDSREAVIAAGTTPAAVIRTAGPNKVGFYGTAPIAKQTGVNADINAIHTALVNLGLISS